MTIENIQKYIHNNSIEVIRFREHTKASEKYVDVLFSYKDQPQWKGSIPYYYRRTGLFLDSEKEIAALIEQAYEALKKENARAWVAGERELWEAEYVNRDVTKSFFDVLLNLRWNCVDKDLPVNRNWARRIQDIKEMGYLLATDTKHFNKRLGKNTTHILLIPLPRGSQTGYEVMSAALRKRILNVLGNYDAYEGKVRPAHALLPDHKFPEISWDEHTREENPDDMTDEEIREKFQLLDNQRNLEKREACRKVMQTGQLGTLFGIEHYMNETGMWPEDIPKIGEASKEGWKLCPWYDIEAWRQSLNNSLKQKKS